MSIASRLKDALDVILGKANPIKSGCGRLNGKYISATKGEISYEEYANWSRAMDIIRETMEYLRSPGTSKVMSGKKLEDFRWAKSIERVHMP